MRWPWSKPAPVPEKRESGGSYSDIIIRLAEAQAAGKAADAASTAAVEAASGALSRAFASATVEGPPWAAEAVSPAFLALVGRDLVRRGQSLHVIRVGNDGRVRLAPAADWNWQDGSDDPESWNVRATCYGPAASVTRLVPAAGVVFVTWSTTPGTPYAGAGPLSWASTTARLQSETERSLADEAGGPVANLIPVPQSGAMIGEDGEEVDPLDLLRADIAGARGKTFLLETLMAGLGEGRASAPLRDWVASRLGPNPPQTMAEVRRDTFNAVLAACGCPPAMFDDSDGTAQRESFRRYLHLTVSPLGRIAERELSRKLEADIRLNFDALMASDLSGRARAFQSLVKGGMDVAKAAALAGLLAEEAA